MYGRQGALIVARLYRKMIQSVSQASYGAGLREKESSTADGPAAAQLIGQLHCAERPLGAGCRCALPPPCQHLLTLTTTCQGVYLAAQLHDAPQPTIFRGPEGARECMSEELKVLLLLLQASDGRGL